MRLSTSFLITLGIATVNGALTRVADFGKNPTNLQMYTNIPANLASKPALILAVTTHYLSLMSFNIITAARLLRQR